MPGQSSHLNRIRGRWKLALPILLVIFSMACSMPALRKTTNSTVAPTAAPTLAPQPTPTQRILPPALVESSPPSGTELPLQGQITLVFNQPMDRPSVESALKVRAFLVSDLEWSDDTTVTIYPGEALQPDSSLSVEVGTEARSSHGLPMLRPVNLEYRTAGYLQLAQQLPEPGANGVNPTSAIMAAFNHPVVPLGADPKILPPAFSLVPVAEGHGEWINTSTYIFYPDPGLGGGKTYTVQPDPSLHGINGNPLQPPEGEWSFTTSMPEIDSFTSYSNERPAPLDAEVTITFNQSMDRESVEENFRVLDPSDNLTAGKFEWGATDSSFSWTPSAQLARQAIYTMILDGAAQAHGGTPLGATFQTSFPTVPELQVIHSNPAPGGTLARYESLMLDLSGPIKDENLTRLIKLFPQVPNLGVYYDNESRRLSIYGSFAPATDYVLSASPELTDLWGSSLGGEDVEPYTLKFRSAPLPPGLVIGMGGFSHSLTSHDRSLAAEITGIRDLPVAIGPVPIEDFVRMTNDYEFRGNYRPADERSWHQKFDVNLNKTQDIRLYLTPDQEALPTGLYSLRAGIPDRGRGSEPQMLVVSDQNLVLKIGATDALVWAAQLSDQTPMAGAPVAIYDSDGELLISGQTDAQGLFYGTFPARKNPYNTALAVVGQPGTENFAAAFSDWNQGIQPWSFDLWASYEGPNDWAYLYTDRPIYRPGQTVFFRAIARKAYDGRYQIPEQKNLTVKLNDDSGQEIDSVELPMSSFGTINGQFDLPASLRPGNYTIYIPDYAYVSVPVADYRKPEIDLKIDFSQDELIAGQDFQAVIDARYFFDAPAGNIPIQWYLYARPASFNIPGYSVGLQGASQWFSGNQGRFGIAAENGEGVTQPDGKLVLDLGPAQTDASRQIYTLEITAQDESGLPVSLRAEIPANPTDYYIGLRPDTWITQAGQALGFDIVTADLDQAPSPNKSLRAEFAKVDWVVDESQPHDPFYGDIYKPVFTQAGSTDFQTGVDGQARLEFTPQEPGAYQLSVFSQASGERQARSEMLVWVGGPGQFVLPDQPNRHIELVPGQDGYKPGETAQVFVPNPFSDSSQALITIERSRIFSSEIKTLETGGTTLSFPLTGKDAPNIYVSVTVLGQNANGKPDFRQGYLKIPVEPSEQVLNVEITRQPEVTGPGRKVDFEIRVTDAAGKPVEGEFSLAVVDLAALKLADPNSLNIVPAFYDIQPIGINTAISLLVYASGEVNKEEFAGGQGGGGGDGSAPSVRERFPDTAFWQADIITGADGKAQVTVQLPDSLTTWQVETRGVTEDTRVGQTKTEVITTKDLIVRPVTPRFLVAGDHLELAAIVQNNTTEPISGEIELHSDGVILDEAGAVRQAFDLPANGRQRISWWGKVDDLPSAKLLFSATANNGAMQDAARPSYGDLPILHYTAPQTFRTVGTLDEAGEQLELVSLPRFYDSTSSADGSGSLDVELSPSLAAAMLQALKVLDEQDCLCTELIISRLLPNLETYRTFKKFGLQSPEGQARLELNLDENLKTLLNRQSYDGGWGWWPGDESDPLMTAYVLFGLTRAKGTGVLSADQSIQRAVEFLKTNFISQSLPEESWQLDRLAFANFALALADAGEPASMDALFQERSKLSPWAQALLALGMERSLAGSPEAGTLFSDLASSAARSAAGAHWDLPADGGVNMTSTLTNSAIVTMALAQHDPAAPLTADAARYLVANRQADGAWTSSYTTAWTLMALNEVMKATGELGGDFAFEAALNDGLIAAGRASGVEQLTPVTTSIPLTQLYSDSPNLLTVGRDAGAGRLYYSAMLKVNQPAAQVAPLSNGISISRDYLPAVLDCSHEDCVSIDSAKPGEKVTVRLTLTVPNDVYHLMVEDYIPAGAEILDLRLNTSQQGQGGEAEAGLPYDPQRPFAKGWGWWLFNEASIYDDHILWSADHLPAGTYELTFSFVPLQAGEFQVLPAHAWEFYFPEVQATSAGSLFTIK